MISKVFGGEMIFDGVMVVIVRVMVVFVGVMVGSYRDKTGDEVIATFISLNNSTNS